MRTFGSRRTIRNALCETGLVAALAICVLTGATVSAQASVAAAPGWEVTPMAFPSHLKPGSQGYILLEIYNVGGASSSGPVTVTDRLPAGLVATEAGYESNSHESMWNCSVGGTVTCTSNAGGLPELRPGDVESLAIAVKAVSYTI